MNITIPRQDLFDLVNRVRPVVAPKSALPILSHILMETGDSCIRVSATDLKVGIECEADCTVLEPGAITISCQRLASMLAELPAEDIELKLVENNIIELKCGRIETKLFSMPTDEFPPIRNFEGIDPLVLKQSELKKLFSRTSFAICTDQARYNLTGSLFELSEGRLTVVSTDGRRMSLAVQDEGLPYEASVKAIIPSKMIHELERLFSDDSEVKVYLDSSQIGFAFGRIRIVTSLIEGNFPNYHMVVPQKHDKEVIIDAHRFNEAMRRTKAMTNDKFNSVRISVSENLMTLKVVTPEVGEHQEDIEVEYSGETVEIAFNPDFILDVMKHIDNEKVCLVLKDGVSPGVVKPYTEAPSDLYVNVVMPIRI